MSEPAPPAAKPAYLVITKLTDGTFDVLDSFGSHADAVQKSFDALVLRPNGKTAVYIAEVKREWRRK
jgi:hypothetical protein